MEIPPIPVEALEGASLSSDENVVTAVNPAAAEENIPAVDMERLLAEAEERGYTRGRNERITELMEHPSQADPSLHDTPPCGEPRILILDNIRPSIWD